MVQAAACHFLLHSEERGPLRLHEALISGMPVVIGLEPYQGQLRIPLQVELGPESQSVCYHIYSEREAYTTPRYIKSYENIPDRTFLLLTQQGNRYTCFLGLSHADQLVWLGAGADGPILQAQTGSSKRCNQRRWALVCLQGTHPHETLEHTMQLALSLTGGAGKLFHDKPPLPDWLYKLGWSSRLLCGQEACFDDILSAVRGLRQQGFSLSYVLIEEGWQPLAINPKDRLLRPCLAGFDADPKRFPSGLRGLVDALRDLGIAQIGVWHASMGARNGIHPKIAKAYGLPTDEDGRFFLGSDLGKTFEFYCDYYGYLRQQGITFVQVGDQLNTHSFHKPGVDVTQVHKNVQIALQAASSTHFNSSHLNSDCLRNQNLFYWPTSSVARAADDIDYTNPVGVLRSIRNNLSNSLWLRQLMLPDFDAWRTDTEDSEMLATFHALGGSLQRIGNGPNHTHTALLRNVVLPSGKAMTADQPLTLCRDAFFLNPLEEKKLYKAFTFKGQIGIIAAFNLCVGHRGVHGTICSTDIEGLSGSLFAVFSHHHGLIGVFKQAEPFSITLKPKASDVFSFVPIVQGIAVLGCHSFYLAPGPITEVVIEDESLHVGSLIAAPVLVYCERKVLEVRRNGEVVPWEYDSKRSLLSLDTRLHIDETPSIYTVSFE